MAKKLLPKDLISSVEGTLQRATIQGMRVHTAVGRSETGSARFSNESLLRYCDTAVVLIAMRAKAESVRPLFEDRTPSGDEFDVSGTLRLRGVTPEVDGAVARRRTRASNEDYSSRGADPTSEYPAWIFEGGEFFIEGASRNPSGAQASFVTAPLTTKDVVQGDSLTSSSLQTDTPAEKHEETIVYLEDSMSGDTYTARVLDTSASGTDLDTTAPDGTYDVHYFDHACAQLGVQHESAVVELASALCFASLGEGDPLQAALSNYADELQSDIMPAFDLSEQSDR